MAFSFNLFAALAVWCCFYLTVVAVWHCPYPVDSACGVVLLLSDVQRLPCGTARILFTALLCGVASI